MPARVRRALTATAATVALAVTAAALTAAPASALGKVKCDVDNQPAVSVAKHDPIVNHNQASSMHEHQFFGNTAWHGLENPNTANYEDLAGKANNCRTVLGLSYSADSAGYWTPTLRYTTGAKAGQLIPAQQFTAYYRPFTNTGKFGEGRAFPADTRLIGTKYSWSCGQNAGTRSKPVSSIPDCTGLDGSPGKTLTAHIDIPSCWNGVLPNHKATDVGDTRDNANYAYPAKGACPAAFPIKMVGVKETIQFAYTGPGNDVGLASDAMMGTSDGKSLHADFWNTWMQPEFEAFIKTCITSKANYSAAKCDP